MNAQWFADGNYIGPAELPTLIKVSTTAPGMEREEVESIARLIAAAPDLLEALQSIIAHESHLINPWREQAARDAIAKAEGMPSDADFLAALGPCNK